MRTRVLVLTQRETRIRSPQPALALLRFTLIEPFRKQRVASRVGARRSERLGMTTRTQRNGCVFASAFCTAFAVAHLASAAHPSAGLPLASPTSKTAPASVKGAREEVPRLALTPPALRVELGRPKQLAPSRSFRHEIVWLGMRIPTLIAFGLSSVSAGGAVVTGFAATRGNDPRTCDTTCAEQNVRRRGLLITTGVLTGVAVAGLGVGVTFMLKEPRDPKADAVRPRLDLRVSGQNAVAKIGWVFSSF